MSRVIYKFMLCDMVDGVAGKPISIDMPVNAVVLSASVQAKTRIVVWADVFDGAKLETRNFWVVPTGGDVPRMHKFVNTVSLFDGNFIMHVYVEEK